MSSGNTFNESEIEKWYIFIIMKGNKKDNIGGEGGALFHYKIL